MPATMKTLVQRLGYALGDLQEYDMAAGGGANAAVIAALITQDTLASAQYMNGKWIYNASLRQQAKVRTNGLTLSGGIVQIDPAWIVPNEGDDLWVTGLFPVLSPVRSPETSYFEIANRAIGWGITRDRLSIPIVPGQTSYSLATWAAWLDDENRFGWTPLPSGEPQPRLLEPGPFGGNPIPADWRRPRLRLDATAPYLEIEASFAAGTTGNLTLNVMRPLWSWIFTNFVWSESTVGLVYHTDQVNCRAEDLDDLLWWEAVKLLAARGDAGPLGRWSDHLAAAEAAARSSRLFDQTKSSAPAAAAVGAA